MSEKINGPEIKLSFSCFKCTHESNEKYNCQGDSGRDVYCNHPTFNNKKRIGDSSWKTPEFCPYLEKYKNIIELCQKEKS